METYKLNNNLESNTTAITELNSDLNGFSVELKPSGTDYNELINGIWLINNGTNSPGEGWWLTVSCGDENTRKQISYDLESLKPIKTRDFSAGLSPEWSNLNAWKYLGSGTYKNWVNITVDYNEIYVEALVNGFVFPFQIPKAALIGTSAENVKKFITGGYFGNDFNAYGIALYATSTGISLDTANYNNQEQSTATLYVYYR